MSTMANRITTAPSAEDSRQKFESAIAQIQQSPQPSAPHRAPIAVRRSPLSAAVHNHATEKRALTEAARALALLWNVSPTRVR
jgi:hypothetical protein